MIDRTQRIGTLYLPEIEASIELSHDDENLRAHTNSIMGCARTLGAVGDTTSWTVYDPGYPNPRGISNIVWNAFSEGHPELAKIVAERYSGIDYEERCQKVLVIGYELFNEGFLGHLRAPYFIKRKQ
ncbi:MAG: hypothetical protein KKD18_05030 [Nanoarchaeota archaeon]|nr:hypothetical protein [Nanoarchaeota archaeon]MBU0977754.1 hypothetical protein [Nanoarchaeota archaeon]